MQVDTYVYTISNDNTAIAYATEMKSIQLHDSIEWLSQKIVSITLHYITLQYICMFTCIYYKGSINSVYVWRACLSLRIDNLKTREVLHTRDQLLQSIDSAIAQADAEN